MFICHQAMQREDGTHFLNELQTPDFEELNDMEQQLHDIVNNGDHFMLHCSEEGDEVQPSHVNDGIVTPLVDHNGENSSKCVPPLMNKAGDQQKLISRFRTTEAPKTKISWSGPLHTRFLKAINVIGIHNVTPKKVLKLMNVPGLTRRNVASHLQKYRLFLKRFADHNFPGLKDRDRALTAAFSATMRVLNTKQGATDISIPCPLSFFRTLVEWRRSSFANFAEGFSTVNALSESLSIDPSAASGKNKSASGSHGGGVIRSRSSHMGGNYNGNHSNPFNSPNPNDNGVAAAFGQSGGGVDGFEMNCFHTTRGPSTELGQATFRRNIAEEEIRYGSGSLTPFFAVNEARALGKVGPNNSSCQINMSRTFPQQGWVDGSLIGASLPPPTQSPSIDVLDDVMWSDEFVASLLDDIRPLLDD